MVRSSSNQRSEAPVDAPVQASARAVSPSAVSRVSVGDVIDSMEVSQDVPLADETMPDVLERQMSQESLTSVSTDTSPTQPTSHLTSCSDKETCLEETRSLIKTKHITNAAVTQPSISQEPGSSRPRSSVTAKVRYAIKPPSQGSLGKSLSRDRPKLFKK